jgi:hypothetical protein
MRGTCSAHLVLLDLISQLLSDIPQINLPLGALLIPELHPRIVLHTHVMRIGHLVLKDDMPQLHCIVSYL